MQSYDKQCCQKTKVIQNNSLETERNLSREEERKSAPSIWPPTLTAGTCEMELFKCREHLIALGIQRRVKPLIDLREKVCGLQDPLWGETTSLQIS